MAFISFSPRITALPTAVTDNSSRRERDIVFTPTSLASQLLRRLRAWKISLHLPVAQTCSCSTPKTSPALKVAFLQVLIKFKNLLRPLSFPLLNNFFSTESIKCIHLENFPEQSENWFSRQKSAIKSAGEPVRRLTGSKMFVHFYPHYAKWISGKSYNL